MGLASSLEQAMGTTGGEASNASPAAPTSLAAGLEAAFKSEPTKAAAPVTARSSEATDASAFGNLKGAGETALSAVSGLGATMIGGWSGLRKLAQGGSMEDAANEVNKEIQKRTYQPETEAGKAGNEAMSSPYNPLNWVGMAANKGGELTADAATALGAKPETAAAAGAAVNTGLNVVIPGTILKGASKLAPRAAPIAGAEKEVGAGTDVVAGKPRIKLKVKEDTPAVFEEVPEVAPDGTALSAAEHGNRAALLERIGLKNARHSAVTGDAKAAATDFQNSKLDNESGKLMKQTLDSERAAVTKYGEKLVDETGGSMGMDESTRTARGNSILKPLQSLKEHFDSEAKKLYSEADKRSAGQPLETPTVHGIVADESEFLGTVEGEALLKGIRARMKALKMTDAEGNPLPITVKEAERLSQYVGEQWQPRTSRLVSKLKNAIEEDVTSAAGEDIYKKARAMRAMRSTVFENDLVDANGRQLNNGLAKIVDASGKRLELLKPTEKIADAVTSLPPEELQHVVETLKHAPKEIQAQATEALAEIRAHMANKVLEAGAKQDGQWNAKGVTRVLNNNAEKMRVIFSPEEIAKFKDLNDAGHILKHSQAYPGAVVQGHNLLQRGVLTGIKSGSAAIGGLGGPLGAAVGERMGSRLANRIEEGMALRATQKRIVRLSDFPR